MSYIPDEILMQVEKPARYTGGELNAVVKDPKTVDVRFAFCFADNYEIGMSHLGMKVLYGLLNSREDVWCERVFAPWIDLEKVMREKGYRLFALESQEEIRNFDFIGFTLQYELSYTNVLNMLDLAGIPVFAKERGEGCPFVIGGGPSALNPEPLADYFDLFNLGDGEEMLLEIMDCYKVWKAKKLPREEFLRMAAKIPGVYVPSFYEAKYGEDGEFLGLSVRPEYAEIAPETVERRVVADFENSYLMKSQVVPYCEAVHDRIMLEIFRGCIRGCRFCQAGYIYRPAREKSPDRLLEAAKRLTDSTGYEELSLLSLATDDYSELGRLTDGLMDFTVQRHMNLALPSLRVDSFSLDLMEKISRVRKSGLTFALEAGTQRLRDVINKGITEEDLMEGCRLAFEAGYTGVKLYFMIGLPTETDEDVAAIADVAKRVRDLYFKVHEGNRVKYPVINVSVSTFVPKAFTPFQWCPQIPYGEIKRKLKMIKDAIGPRFGFSWQDPELSVVENILARGDRRSGRLIYNVWRKTGGFDAWSEHFSYAAWTGEKKLLGTVSVEGWENPDKDGLLPWDFVDIGVTKKFLAKEYDKAMKGETTPNCREKCAGCGAAKYGGGVCVGKR